MIASGNAKKFGKLIVILNTFNIVPNSVITKSKIKMDKNALALLFLSLILFNKMTRIEPCKIPKSTKTEKKLNSAILKYTGKQERIAYIIC